MKLICVFVHVMYVFVSPFCACVFLFPDKVPWNSEVDLCWHTLVREASDECDPEWCDSEDPIFILYTSGSTGKPKVE